MSHAIPARATWLEWVAWAALAFQAFFAMTNLGSVVRPEYGGFAALVILVVAGGRKCWRELARHPLCWLLLAFVIYAVAQAAWAARLAPALPFGKQLAYNAKPINLALLTCAVGAWLAQRPQRIPLLLGLMAAGFVFAALVCTPWARLDAIVAGTLRLRLHYAENIVGEYAAMALLLVALYALSRAPPRRRGAAVASAVILALAGVLLLACLLYAQSRAAWLAAVLVPLCAFAGLRDVPCRSRRGRLVTLGVAALVVLVAVGIGYTLVAHRLAGGEAIAAALAHGELAELPPSSVTMRLQLYALGGHIWHAHPLLGVGLRGIKPWIVASDIHVGQYVPPHLHNAYLETLAGLGGIGAALLLAMLALLLHELWLARRSGDADTAVYWALLGCLGIALVANLFDYLAWRNDYLRAPLELLLGCCFALSLRRRRTDSAAARRAGEHHKPASMQPVAARRDAGRTGNAPTPR